MFSAFLIAAATIAPAQPRAAEPAIVVTGEAPLSPAATARAIDAITVSKNLRLARYHDAVCPLVIGVRADAARVIEDGIRAVAKQAGAPVAAGRCDGNLVVVITRDANAMFRDIRATRPQWLNGLSATEVNALARENGPVRAWWSTTLRNEDGVAQGSVDRGSPQSLQVRSASILAAPTREQIDGSVIIIEQSAAAGKTLVQLADYAAMRGLARARPPADADVPTVLNLFSDKARAPAAMTRFDIGYLKALYASKGRETAIVERARIERALLHPGN